MITKEQVAHTLKLWERAGMEPPLRGTGYFARLVDEFWQRFHFMDEATLKCVEARLSLGVVWPTFSVISEVAKEYEENNSKYVYMDYYDDLERAAYGPDEDFDSFVERIAGKYFADKSQEWRRRHAFVLNFYGVRMATCRSCNGDCPYGGHQYYLRMEKGSDDPVPYASLDICHKYKQSVDKEGRSYANVQEDWSHEEDGSFEPPEAYVLEAGALSGVGNFAKGKSKKDKEPSLFGQGSEDVPLADKVHDFEEVSA